MKLVFSNEPFPTEVTKSIFLAGPSPRYKEGDEIQTNTWRHYAIDYLKSLNYDGIVYIPIPRDFFYGEKANSNLISYLKQIDYEQSALERADIILFYLDRKNDNEGLTTNVEFGKYYDSGRVVYCRPKDAVKVRYLDNLCFEKGLTIYLNLNEALEHSLYLIGDGIKRINGECTVPSIIFKSEQFQTWYQNLLKAGNELKDFKVTSIINPNETLFGFSAWASVYITNEERYKTNEWIFSRIPVSYVVPYYIEGDKTYFVLTSEFRTSVNNSKGRVFELAGGSTTKPGITPIQNAIKELEEETGLIIKDESRYKILGERQTFATYLTMKLYAVSVELTKEEFLQVVDNVNKDKTLGENEEEQIKLHIATLDEVMNIYPVDWTTLGIMKSLEYHNQNK